MMKCWFVTLLASVVVIRLTDKSIIVINLLYQEILETTVIVRLLNHVNLLSPGKKLVNAWLIVTSSTYVSL